LTVAAEPIDRRRPASAVAPGVGPQHRAAAWSELGRLARLHRNAAAAHACAELCRADAELPRPVGRPLELAERTAGAPTELDRLIQALDDQDLYTATAFDLNAAAVAVEDADASLAVQAIGLTRDPARRRELERQAGDAELRAAALRRLRRAAYHRERAQLARRRAWRFTRLGATDWTGFASFGAELERHLAGRAAAVRNAGIAHADAGVRNTAAEVLELTRRAQAEFGVDPEPAVQGATADARPAAGEASAVDADARFTTLIALLDDLHLAWSLYTAAVERLWSPIAQSRLHNLQGNTVDRMSLTRGALEDLERHDTA
jgi:hypothetical protein